METNNAFLGNMCTYNIDHITATSCPTYYKMQKCVANQVVRKQKQSYWEVAYPVKIQTSKRPSSIIDMSLKHNSKIICSI